MNTTLEPALLVSTRPEEHLPGEVKQEIALMSHFVPEQDAAAAFEEVDPRGSRPLREPKSVRSLTRRFYRSWEKRHLDALHRKLQEIVDMQRMQSVQRSSFPLCRLPRDIWAVVLSFLNVSESHRIARTCRLLFRLSLSQTAFSVIERLNLWANNPSDLTYLERFSNLRRLSLSLDWIDVFLVFFRESIYKCSKLEELEVNCVDSGRRSIWSYLTPRTIFLDSNPVSALDNLKKLTLTGINCSRYIPEIAARFLAVKHVALKRCFLVLEDLQILVRCPSLVRVSFDLFTFTRLRPASLQEPDFAHQHEFLGICSRDSRLKVCLLADRNLPFAFNASHEELSAFTVDLCAPCSCPDSDDSRGFHDLFSFARE